MDDRKIYRKARNHVVWHLIFYFLLVCVFVIGTDLVLNLDFLKFAETGQHQTFILVSLIEIFLWLLLFLGLSTGQKWVRWLYWVMYILEVASFWIPVRAMMNDWTHIFVYLTWMFCLFIKLAILMQTGLYFHQNRWARVYYDHVLEVYDDDPLDDARAVPARTIARTPAAAYVQPANPAEAAQVRQTAAEQHQSMDAIPEEKPLTWPQVSVRLGICIYGELVVFPIFVQMFQGWFSSLDMRSVFATRDMFLLCIFTAFIWTIPVFFLYYSQKGTRRVIYGVIAAEVLFSAWFATRLMAYHDTGLYPDRVFILFILLDIIRYGLIGAVISPVLMGKAKRDPHHRQDMGLRLDQADLPDLEPEDDYDEDEDEYEE